MATSSCPKCDSHSFELKSSPIKGAAVPFNFIQCASCGCVVGLVDTNDLVGLLQDVLTRLDDLEDLIKQGQ